MNLTRRQVALSLASLTLLWRFGPARAAKPFEPSSARLDAANREGAVVLYTAAFPEIMQDQIAQFNKRFPRIKINMVRASGGQLITRVRSEAASGKLEADVLDPRGHVGTAVGDQVEGIAEVLVA